MVFTLVTTVTLGGSAPQRECRSEITCSPPNPTFFSWTKGLTQVRTRAHDKRALEQLALNVHVKSFMVMVTYMKFCIFILCHEVKLFTLSVSGHLVVLFIYLLLIINYYYYY